MSKTFQEAKTKRLLEVHSAPPKHWVGDGFPVRSVITPAIYDNVTPFLLMDYGEPFEFEPSDQPRGVDSHPHKGFETVTIAFQGELEHRDSAGHKGKIGPGDVQWMTAGSGILHEEKHSERFTKSGGTFEVSQIWMNLPAKHKSAPPGYQDITKDRIPIVDLPNGAGKAAIIAGDFNGSKGPARTFTPVELWSIDLNKSATMDLPIPKGHTAAIFVRKGKIAVDDAKAGQMELAVFDREGAGIKVKAEENSSIIVLAGEPIDEPVAAYGPFVMNTDEEIRQAVKDFQSGKMGIL